ncbi:uncharacterized protein ACR2FA_003050 [Aphomia sociella]
MATEHSASNSSALQGWTKDEKFVLLQSIKMYSSHNLEEILQSLPSKTPEEIKNAIDHYKQKALNHPKVTTRNKKTNRNYHVRSRVPLNSWAKLLSDTFNFKDLETETATALRIIAQFETIPLAVSTEDIDFRKVYHLLANALEGKPLHEDKKLTAIVEKCLLETAVTSKSFIRKSTLKNVIENINMSEGEINMFPRPTHVNELAAVRHLASQRSYNPLNIPETFFKPSL